MTKLHTSQNDSYLDMRRRLSSILDPILKNDQYFEMRKRLSSNPVPIRKHDSYFEMRRRLSSSWDPIIKGDSYFETRRCLSSIWGPGCKKVFFTSWPEGGVMCSSLLELAGHTLWSDLDDCSKSAIGQILGGSGQHFGPGTFWGQSEGSEKDTL